jgi:hypothetical protein
MLLERPWIYSARVVTFFLFFFLHQRLKYIANERFIIIKAKQTIIIMKNIVVPYIELEGVKNGDLHTLMLSMHTYL